MKTGRQGTFNVIAQPEKVWLEAGAHPEPDKGFCEDREALLFHTTTRKNAEAILKKGFKPSPTIQVGGHPHLGIPGRFMPSGVWASIRPVIPYDLDIWMPHIYKNDWVILIIRTNIENLLPCMAFEHTWPVTQFCLPPASINSCELLPPDKMPDFLCKETKRSILEGVASYHAPSPYLDALIKNRRRQ